MKTLLSAVSNFSILRGILSPESICKFAREFGYTSVAITDRNNLYGLPAFIRSCKEHAIACIIAAELLDEQGCSVLIYAEGDCGFSNLCRIISEFHCDKKFRLIDSIIKEVAGLHVLTDNMTLLQNLRGKCKLYYRMKRPKSPPPWIRAEGIPCIIAPSMIFTAEDDFQIHQLLRAVDCNTTLSRLPQTELFQKDAFFESWEMIQDRFEVFDYAIDATVLFAEKLSSRKKFGAPIMPRLNEIESSVHTLRNKAFEGAFCRYGELNDTIVKRLDYELDLIQSKGFSDYFLVVDDIVKQSPRTCGRGSGAASIVAYSLGITNVDPIRYNLMFERFLNPGS